MKTRNRKIKHSIILKIYTVVLVSSVSLILFILGISGVIRNAPNPFYAHIHLVITFIILVIVNAMVISFLIRKILRPLSELSDYVEKVGQGNLDLTIPVNTRDELGDWSIAFNKMIVDLRNMMKAREQLLLDVSHELRTPITRARIALEMMPESSQKSSIQGDLKEMEMMITEILESERIKNGMIQLQLAPVSVKRLLSELVEIYQRETDRIMLLPVSSELYIQSDERQIITVLRNVLDNALKYSPKEGPPVEISVVDAGDEIAIRIEDFGPGIPTESLPFVFEPFYRADQSRSRSTGGYGLGLHLCKRIMDLHQAEIKLQNKPDNKGLITSLVFKTSKRVDF